MCARRPNNRHGSYARLFLIVPQTRPTRSYHQCRAAPDFHTKLGTKPFVAPLAGRATPSPSNTFGECAKEGCGPCVRASVTAEKKRLVGDVLAIKHAGVLSVVMFFPGMHRLWQSMPACCASGGAMPMSSASRPGPSAHVSTSAGRTSVPGIKPCASSSAAGSICKTSSTSARARP